MKKLLALLLCLAMALGLCACGAAAPQGEIKDASELKNKEKTELSEALEEAAEEVEESAAAEIAEEAEEALPPKTVENEENEENEEDEETAEIEEAFDIGAVSGGRYENAFLGIGCELGEDWTYLEREQLAEMVGLATDLFEDENYREKIAQADMFQDMYAGRQDGLATVNVMIQNLGVTGLIVSEKALLDNSTAELESAFEGAGMTIKSVERNSGLFAGEIHEGIRSELSYQDVPYYVQQYGIKVGTHLAVVTLGSFVEDQTAALAEYCFALD